MEAPERFIVKTHRELFYCLDQKTNRYYLARNWEGALSICKHFAEIPEMEKNARISNVPYATLEQLQNNKP